MVVVFPAPFGPKNQNTSPGATERLTLWRISFLSSILVSSLSSKIGGDISFFMAPLYKTHAGDKIDLKEMLQMVQYPVVSNILLTIYSP